jgi:hypothetical protein
LEPEEARRLEVDLSASRTRKRQFLGERERVVRWKALVALTDPHDPEEKQRGAPARPSPERACCASGSCGGGWRFRGRPWRERRSTCSRPELPNVGDRHSITAQATGCAAVPG